MKSFQVGLIAKKEQDGQRKDLFLERLKKQIYEELTERERVEIAFFIINKECGSFGRHYVEMYDFIKKNNLLDEFENE